MTPRRPALRPALLAGLIGCGVVSGCARDPSQPRPPTASERQDAILADPFGYGPTLDEAAATEAAKEPPPTVSGGGTGEFDRRGFRRDLDAVFNP